MSELTSTITSLKTSTLSSDAVEKIEKSVFIELPVDLNPTTEKVSFSIEPTKKRTVVSANIYVTTAGAALVRTPAYVASVRRRRVKAIITQIADLAKHIDRDDFTCFVFPILDSLRKLSLSLFEHERFEGNTLVILRYVSNTLLVPDDERLKEEQPRNVITSVLELLLTADEIDPSIVKKTFRMLHQGGLNPNARVVVDFDTALQTFTSENQQCPTQNT